MAFSTPKYRQVAIFRRFSVRIPASPFPRKAQPLQSPRFPKVHLPGSRRPGGVQRGQQRLCAHEPGKYELALNRLSSRMLVSLPEFMNFKLFGVQHFSGKFKVWILFGPSTQPVSCVGLFWSFPRSWRRQGGNVLASFPAFGHWKTGVTPSPLSQHVLNAELEVRVFFVGCPLGRRKRGESFSYILHPPSDSPQGITCSP